MKTIDLNCDIGESFGVYKLGMDQEVMPFISSANIACGWHAGDPVTIAATVSDAAAHGIGCGAHPGYPDLLGFGRRQMSVKAEELKCYTTYQIGALDAFCRANNTRLRHVKPHGSLYHAILSDQQAAIAVVEAIAGINKELIFVTLAGSKGDRVSTIGKAYGLKVAREAFPDRSYTSEGTLVERTRPGAVIEDTQAVVERALQIATEKRIYSLEGHVIDLHADTICVHGDTPGAVDIVKKVRRKLEAANIIVTPMLRNGLSRGIA